jgi:hypothetical protein
VAPTLVGEFKAREDKIKYVELDVIGTLDGSAIMYEGSTVPNYEDPDEIEELITVDEGGFLAFIVSGNIIVDSSEGHTNLSDTVGNIEGVYVADGSIIISSNGEVDKRFVGEGTFVGWTNVNLMRNFNSEEANGAYPTETFVYRPDFVRCTPEKMKHPQVIW